VSDDARDLNELPGFRALEFDLPSALLREVISVFDQMEAGSLSIENAAAVPNAQGVYQLFHADRLVYIGKTDAAAGLRTRLSRHAFTIRGRHNLNVAEMSFKAVQVLVFSAMDLETALIAHYKQLGKAPAWNGSGFGSNDPGRQRDKTALREDGFDANYPINVDIELEGLTIPAGSAVDALARLSERVPYTIRYERSERALSELRAVNVQPLHDPVTTRLVIGEVCRQLPPGWQATKLPGRVIMYRERVDDYPGGEIIALSGD
jgi:hypothetical protein